MTRTLVFTGTLRGVTFPQYMSLKNFLGARDSLHIQACHGLAVGADEQFHQICRELTIPLLGFPGNILSKRADIPVSDFVQVFPEKYPITRNRDMIDFAVLSSGSDSLLITCPKRETEEVRSGTWTTVRYARVSGIDMAYIWPSDGAIELRHAGSPHYYSKTRIMGYGYGTGEGTSSEAVS